MLELLHHLLWERGGMGRVEVGAVSGFLSMGGCPWGEDSNNQCWDEGEKLLWGDNSAQHISILALKCVFPSQVLLCPPAPG